ASLKLSRVKVSDEGEYTCLIRSEDWFDDMTVEVSVEVVGTQPVISMEDYSIGKGVSLLCETKDWWPEPEVLWLDNDGNPLPAEDTETLRDPERFHVKKRVTVQDSNTNRFYCRVMLRDRMKETEIVISQSIFRTWITAVVCISVAVLVTVIGLIGLFLSIHRMKGFDKEKQNEFNRRRRKHAMNVTMDPDTAHPLLKLSADGKQVTYKNVPQELSENEKRFVDSKSVLGKEGFSSGRFYYEVQVSGKTTWSLGVVSESIDRAKHMERKPENGLWVFTLLHGTLYMARADPNVSFSVKQKPQKNELAKMNPADTDSFHQALISEGALVGQIMTGSSRRSWRNFEHYQLKLLRLVIR
ncbi:butyrophilin subfamily 1 member A1-like, partial [Chanos chanos]|uniref:Butyrophilin subfamily 1 member A1-like n=1 Tax=Chanos chanos TaxID=29144 RepID=A0A6J2VT69_CHACN